MNADWRKVSDEMPDSDQSVLIATVGDGEPVWLGYHDGEDWLTVEGTFCEVSHWAPMPAGPQEATR